MLLKSIYSGSSVDLFDECSYEQYEVSLECGPLVERSLLLLTQTFNQAINTMNNMLVIKLSLQVPLNQKNQSVVLLYRWFKALQTNLRSDGVLLVEPRNRRIQLLWSLDVEEHHTDSFFVSIILNADMHCPFHNYNDVVNGIKRTMRNTWRYTLLVDELEILKLCEYPPDSAIHIQRKKDDYHPKVAETFYRLSEMTRASFSENGERKAVFGVDSGFVAA